MNQMKLSYIIALALVLLCFTHSALTVNEELATVYYENYNWRVVRGVFDLVGGVAAAKYTPSLNQVSTKMLLIHYLT
jgi:hypothetical protein